MLRGYGIYQLGFGVFRKQIKRTASYVSASFPAYFLASQNADYNSFRAIVDDYLPEGVTALTATSEDWETAYAAYVSDVQTELGTTTITSDNRLLIPMEYWCTRYGSSSEYSPDNSEYTDPNSVTTSIWPDGTWGVRHYTYVYNSGDPPNYETLFTFRFSTYFTYTVVVPGTYSLAYNDSSVYGHFIYVNADVRYVPENTNPGSWTPPYQVASGSAGLSTGAELTATCSYTFSLGGTSSYSTVYSEMTSIGTFHLYCVPYNESLLDYYNGAGRSGRMGSVPLTFAAYDESDNLVPVENTYIVNEGDNEYYDIVNNVTYDMSSYTYDYSTRTYEVTYVDNDTVTQTTNVTYGDECITVVQGGNTYNYYYAISA